MQLKAFRRILGCPSHNMSLNADRPKAALLGALRAARFGGRLALR